MITRLTNGAVTLEVDQASPARDAWVSTTPAGSVRRVTARRVPALLSRYRARGYVDPAELALHRARVSGEGATLGLLPAARAFPELTAAVVRQLLAEAPHRNRTAAAAFLGVTRQTLLRAVAAIPSLHEELAADPAARGGGWRDGHADRAAPKRPEKSTGHPEKTVDH